MSPSNTVFLDSQNLVVQVIVGSLNQEQQNAFLHDYGILYGAVAAVEVGSQTAVWIGGSYTDGVFMPPPGPEPQLESLPEPQLEPEVT